MEWLSEWIKQIILLVLIATFIDLLLPNHSFDRYVKLVLGLLIIMAILAPILQLINQDFDLSSFTLWKENGSVPSMKSIPAIQEQSEKLKAYRMNQVQHQWEQSLKQMMEKDLSKKFALKQVEVKVKGRVKENETPQIETVDVYAEPYDHPDQNHPSESIKPIDSIQVELNKGKVRKIKHPFINKIKSHIQSTWNLQSEQIEVTVEVGA